MLTILQDTADTLPTIPLYEGDIWDDMEKIKTVKQANKITGGLSRPSKMPGYAYNLPASRCRTGGRLRTVAGSVCHGCYAADTIEWAVQKCRASESGKWSLTRYTTPVVKTALERRFQSLSHPLWVPAMIYLVRHYSTPGFNRSRRAVGHFRWHDAGDLQDKNHLDNIGTVAEHTRRVKHWLPTREYAIVRACGPFPKNLVVRLSAHMVDGAPPSGLGFPTSTVSTGKKPRNGGSRCHANRRGGQCGGCRKCWNSEIENVDYGKHS